MSDEHVITRDIYCIGCGYNLRNLDPSGACPECGMPIERSLQTSILRFASPDWLRNIRRGFNLVIFIFVMNLLLGVAVGVSAGGGAPVVGGSFFAASNVIGLISQLVYIWAIFLITAPDPRQSVTESPRSWRRLTRMFILAGFACFAAGLLAQEFASMIAFMAIGVVANLIQLGLIFCGLSYLQTLAERVPDPKLAKNTATMKWAIMIMMVLLVVFAVVFLVMAGVGLGGFGAAPGAAPPAGGGGPGPAAGAVVAGVSCFVGVLGFAVFILGIVLFFRYRSAIGRALKEAESYDTGHPPVAPLT